MRKTPMGKTVLASAIAALFLAGCGGSGSSGDTEKEPIGTATEIGGRVADGYLVGAIVCLDLNRSGTCDDNEPQAVTSAGGVYELDVSEHADWQSYPLAVEVPADAIDEDDGQVVGDAFYLAAPAGQPGFISPITTMVEKELVDNPGLDVVDAEYAVRSRLGLDDDIDVLGDYVAAKTDDDRYAVIHRTAQIVAEVLKEHTETIRFAAGEAGLDPNEVMRELSAILMDAVLSKASTIVDLARVEEGFDPANALQEADVKVSSDNLQEEVERRQELASTQLPDDLRALMEAASYWYYAHGSQDVEGGVEFGVVKVWMEQQEGALPTLGELGWHYSGDTWSDETGNSQQVLLTQDGWMMVDDSANSYEITEIDGNTLRATHKDSGLGLQMRTSVLDLKDRKVKDVIGTWANYWEKRELAKGIDEAFTFSDGALGLVRTFIRDEAHYKLNHSVSFGGESVTALDDLKLAEGASPGHDGAADYIYLNQQVRVLLYHGGKVYFEQRRDDAFEAARDGYWEERVAHGQRMLVVPVTEALSEEGITAYIFAVYNGAVHVGDMVPGGIPHTDLDFNRSAIEDFILALGKNPLPQGD